MDKNLFLTSSGVNEPASKPMRAAEQASEASSTEQVNERAVRANERGSGLMLTSGFMAVLTHSAHVNGYRSHLTTDIHDAIQEFAN